MARENIRFNGINRNSNVSDSRPGDCEELINVRSENGALKIIKDHVEISSNIPYRDIIIHEVAGVRNFIGKDSSGWVWFDPDSGIALMRMYDAVEDVFVSTLNNMLTFSDKQNIVTKTYLYSNTANTYSLFTSGLDVSINPTVTSSFYDGDHDTTEDPLAPSKAQYLSALQGFVNKFKIDNKTYSEGIFLYAFTVTLYDGKETGMYGLNAIATGYKKNPAEANAFISIAENPGGSTPNLYTRIYWDRFYQQHVMTIAPDDSLVLNYKDIIKSVNLYVSVPITRMPLIEENVNLKNVIFEDGKVETLAGEFSFDVVYPKDSKAEKSLLYRQKTWTLEEFAQGLDYTLEFGGDIQATGKTMEVSASSQTRAGEMFNYNNMLHFFNSAVRLDVPLGNIYKKSSDDYPDIIADIYVFLKINGADQVIKYSDITLATRSNSVQLFPAINLPDMIVYSDSRAYRMLIVTVDPSVMIEGYSKLHLDVSLLSSPAYNYAYAYSSTGGMVPSNFDESEVNISSIYYEPDSLNVTSQGNPLIFPVEHSYLFPGDIKSLSYATEPISQTQVGQYPLYVFTNKGIFAMEQGAGAVLYANQVMINTDKCSQDVVQTRNGVVYIANNSIYILSGRNSLQISLPLDGSIDTDIRRAEAYSECCMSGLLYDVEHNISQIEIKEYLEDVNLVYIPYRDELIVSNPDYKYSYVFSFIYKTWHKVTDSFESVGGNIIRRAVSASSSVAKAAKGEIIVASAVVTAAHTFSAVQQAIYSGGDFISGTNERYALVVDGVQVSSALFRYPTRLPLMLAILCKDIPYLDCWYDGSSHFILTDMAFDTGSQLELVQLSNSYKVFGVPFSEYQAVVSIPDKAIGSNLSVSSSNGGTASTRAIKESDTVLTIAAGLNTAINTSTQMGFMSELSVNVLSLTAETAGAAGNDIEISFDTGDYVNIVCVELSGGKNISLEPGNYGILEDCTREKHCSKTIHIQSRPMAFSDAFTLVRRMVFHCKASLTGEKNLSFYLFASNDLNSWQCVAAAQRGNTQLDHIRLQRSGRAYKYYVVIIGGQVYTTTELSYLMVEIEDKFNSKIR